MSVRGAVGTAAKTLLLVISVPLSGGSAVSAQSASEVTEHVPALLAIRALRASLGTGIPSDRLLMRADGPLLQDRQAAQLLAQMGPSFCSAMYGTDAVKIDCQPFSVAEQERARRHFELTNGWLGELARETLGGSDGQLILVIGGGEPLLAGIEQIDIAARTFFIDIDGFSISGRPPNDEERLLGVAWVLQFSGRGAY